MSSKRAVRRRACEGKQRYTSQAKASTAAFVMLVRRNEHLFPYRCKFCRGFHIGHNPQLQRIVMSRQTKSLANKKTCAEAPGPITAQKGVPHACV